MRRCRKRNASSPGACASGRTSSLRTSAISRAGTSVSSGASASTRRGGRSSPRPRRARARRALPDSSWSSRAASSAWIVGGTTTSPSATLATIASICSTKSGLPSAASRMRHAARLVERDAAEQPLDQLVRLRPRSSGSSSTVVALSLPPAHAGRRSSSSGRAMQSEQDRRVARPVGDVLDEIEEGRLGPVEVVEDDDERPPAPPASSSLRTAQAISSAGAGSPLPSSARARAVAAAARSPASW